MTKIYSKYAEKICAYDIDKLREENYGSGEGGDFFA